MLGEIHDAFVNSAILYATFWYTLVLVLGLCLQPVMGWLDRHWNDGKPVPVSGVGMGGYTRAKLKASPAVKGKKRK